MEFLSPELKINEEIQKGIPSDNVLLEPFRTQLLPEWVRCLCMGVSTPQCVPSLLVSG